MNNFNSSTEIGASNYGVEPAYACRKRIPTGNGVSETLEETKTGIDQKGWVLKALIYW